MDLKAWIRACGGSVSDVIDLCHELSPGGDRGIVAKEPIDEGVLLIEVPESCCITAGGDAGSSQSESDQAAAPESYAACLSYLRSLQPAPSPFVACVLLYLHEALGGSQSHYAPYIAALPTDVDCLLLWGDQDKKELTGTSVDVGGELKVDGLAAAFHKVVDAAIAARPDLFPAEPLQQAAEAAVKALQGATSAASARAAAAGDATTSSTSTAGQVDDALAAESGALAAFRRAAAMVQSRAFHMERQNWITGEEEECVDLFLIPGIDMVNHATDPTRRNTTLTRRAAGGTAAPAAAAAPAAGGASGTNTGGAFELRTSRRVAAGEQLLHTYGDMADARLLQIYGFVDLQSSPLPMTRLEASASKGASKGGKADAADKQRFVNPHNSVLLPWPVVLNCCRRVIAGGKQGGQEEEEEEEEEAPRGKGGKAKRAASAKGGAVKKAKPSRGADLMEVGSLSALEKRQVALLQRVGLLQTSDSEATCFVLTAGDPLPSELLTTLQILLMSAGELKQLERHTRSVPPEDSGTLCLGTRLMEAEPDFGEVVCLAAIQVVDACSARYPTSARDDAATAMRLKNQLPPRHLFALAVRLGEKDVLQACKKAALSLLMSLEGGDEDEGSSGDDEEGEDGADEEEDLLYNSEDSDKVGLADLQENDDGIGQLHDRGAPHELPPPSDDEDKD